MRNWLKKFARPGDWHLLHQGLFPLKTRIVVTMWVWAQLGVLLYHIESPLNGFMAGLALLFGLSGWQSFDKRWLQWLTLVVISVVAAALGSSLSLDHGLIASWTGLVIGQLSVHRTWSDVRRLLMFGLATTSVVFAVDSGTWVTVWTLCAVLITSVMMIHVINMATASQAYVKPSLWKLQRFAAVMGLALAVVILTSLRLLTWDSFQALQHRAQTGLGDKLTPGNVSSLLQSDATAFRVIFDHTPPTPSQWYWRGVVMYDFDGQTWSTRPPVSGLRHADLTYLGPSIDYTWMPGDDEQRAAFLDQIVPSGGIVLDSNFAPSFGVVGKLKQSIYAFHLKSQPAALWPNIDKQEEAWALALPEANPQTKAFAQKLWTESRHVPQTYIRMVRAYFHEHLAYTLNPPLLGKNAVDDFLFESHEGFCVHIAGAFAVLMREVGLPARLVGGYQGGHWNNWGKYWQIRQSDAHAWVEVWMPVPQGHSWVRFDPTRDVLPLDASRAANNSNQWWSGLWDFTSYKASEIAHEATPNLSLSLPNITLTDQKVQISLLIMLVLLSLLLWRLIKRQRQSLQGFEKAVWRWDRLLMTLGCPENSQKDGIIM